MSHPIIELLRPGRSTKIAKRSVTETLAVLDSLAAGSSSLIAKHDAKFEVDGQTWVLPRYLFIGPEGGDAPIRIGLFAGIHGDEPEVGKSLIVSFQRLESDNSKAMSQVNSILCR